MSTMTLHCEVGAHDWSRPSQRGRPPRVCPDCKNGKRVVKATQSKPKRVAKTTPVATTVPQTEQLKQPKARKPRKRKPMWYEEVAAKPQEVLSLPLSERASGWCTDYDPAPEAQHDKCDGDLGKSRCRCPEDCHGWNN